MANEDTYRSIRGRAEAEIKIKGSRFIAEAVPVSSVSEAEEEIARVRKREHGATHHCTAYRVGVDGDVVRWNEDGEPSGAAGPPILRRIEAHRLTNILVVVTRYFGGTKLGTGGLARAYGDAVERALAASILVEHVISERVNVSFEYDDTSPAMRTIDRLGATVVETNYSQRTELAVEVPRSKVRAFVDAFVEALGGRGSVVVGGRENDRG